MSILESGTASPEARASPEGHPISQVAVNFPEDPDRHGRPFVGPTLEGIAKVAT
jgi:hypothetical protein